MSKSAAVPSPPPETLVQLSEALASFQHLMILNSLWVGGRRVSTAEGSKGKVAFEDLSARLDDAYGDASKHVAQLQEVFDQFPQWVDASVAAALASDRFTDEERQQLTTALATTDGKFAAKGSAITVDLANRSVNIEGQIDNPFNKLGDLGEPVLASDATTGQCSMIQAVVVLELAACPATEGVGCALAAGTWYWGHIHHCW